ncbi:MAG: TlyA family RNA methyltransferase [Candidatus Riflebacteria bacterium]|nr:TlyA family RNA methyltransferase [Candidatus Riflebacteria bacterium]
MAKKARVDEMTVQQGLADNLEMARKLIMSGEIRTKDHLWNKAGEKIPIETLLEHKPRHCKWVSMGGLKLEKALKDFSVSPKNLRCLDIGASTGGFTDVLLFNGAKEVVALDVGRQLLDPKIQNDPRVIIKDKTNFKTMDTSEFPENFDLIVTDVSFISLEHILPKATKLLTKEGAIIALIKPQFEAEKHLVPEGGIITDPNVQINVINRLKSLFISDSLYLWGLTPVPLVSKRKNIEFVSFWKALIPPKEVEPNIEQTVLDAHKVTS